MSKRQDFLDFVKSQVGTVGGDKYRKWYNENVGNIGNYNWYWCAAGISYSMAKTGIDKSVFMPTASSSAILNYFKSIGRFRPRGTYIPKGGDIILFRWSGATTPASHVGVVEYTDKKYVHTIEFNSGSMTDGAVARWKHLLTNTSIVGYCVPDFPKEITKIKRESYIRSNPWLDSKYQSSKILKTLKEGDKVEYISDDKYGWSKIRFKGVEGYIQNTRLEKENISTFRKATVLKNITVKGVKTDDRKKFTKGDTVTFICTIEKGLLKGTSVIRKNGVPYYIKSNNIIIK